MLGNLFGGLLGGAFDFGAAAMNNAEADKQAKEDYARQKEFVQNSIQWRVQDAKSAGIHPLAALGGSGVSYSPSGSTGGGFGDALGRTGQALSRAVSNSFLTPEQKLNRKSAQLDIDLKEEALKQERAKTANMQKNLNKVGQNPEPMQATVTPRTTAPLAIKKGKEFTGNKAVNKEKPSMQLLRYGNGFRIVPGEELSDAADAMIGASFQTTMDKHQNPQFWYDSVKKQLPPVPKGKKYVMKRDLTGWNVYVVDKNEDVGQGMFSHDPNYKPNKYGGFKWLDLRKRK